MQPDNKKGHPTDDPPPPAIQKQTYRVEVAPLTIVIAVVIATGAWMLIRLLPVVLVLIVALMIVGTLTTAVKWLEARKMRRGAAIAIVFSATLLLLFLLVTLMIPALVSQVSSLITRTENTSAISQVSCKLCPDCAVCR